jgi:DnaJ homolog subfamily C member 3
MKTSTLRRATLGFLAFVSQQSYSVVSQTAATPTEEEEEASSWSAGKLRSAAEEAFATGETATALRYLQYATAKEPDNPVNHFRLYKIHHRKRQYVEALDDITKAVELDNNNANNSPDSYRPHKARLLVQMGQCDRAVVEYEAMEGGGSSGKARENISSDFSKALICQETIEAAQLAYFQQDYEQAAAHYQAALQFVEVASDLIWPKAQALFEIEDFYGVISDTAKLLKLHPRHLEAYRLRGSAYYYLAEHEQAILHYREALKLDPEHKACKDGHKLVKKLEKSRKKGDDALEKGDYEAALENYEKARSWDASHYIFNRMMHLKVIKTCSKLGQHDKAIAEANAYLAVEETLEGLLALGDGTYLQLDKINDHVARQRAMVHLLTMCNHSLFILCYSAP